MPAIRNQIRELRATREMTQQELADRVGVTRQTVIARFKFKKMDRDRETGHRRQSTASEGQRRSAG